MKKIVPDPPFFTVPELTPFPDALMHLIELLRGVCETLDQHCRHNIGEPGNHMLINAAHATDIARALGEHVLNLIEMAQQQGAQ